MTVLDFISDKEIGRGDQGSEITQSGVLKFEMGHVLALYLICVHCIHSHVVGYHYLM